MKVFYAPLFWRRGKEDCCTPSFPSLLMLTRRALTMLYEKTRGEEQTRRACFSRVATLVQFRVGLLWSRLELWFGERSSMVYKISADRAISALGLHLASVARQGLRRVKNDR